MKHSLVVWTDNMGDSNAAIVPGETNQDIIYNLCNIYGVININMNTIVIEPLSGQSVFEIRCSYQLPIYASEQKAV